tara:strand:+ start:219 stop:689 length:471 start_codon:yes stop_codon:yes gene_type:complete
MAKNKSVSKEALDASGYKGDLRGYMNNYKYDDEAGEYVKRAVPLTKRKDDMVLSKRTPTETAKGYARIPTKRKVPIVTQADLDESKYGTLREYMNNYKYDDAKGKYMPRANALTRREDKQSDAKASPVTYSAKKGGSVSSRGDGCAQRGKTRGKMR